MSEPNVAEKNHFRFINFDTAAVCPAVKIILSMLLHYCSIVQQLLCGRLHEKGVYHSLLKVKRINMLTLISANDDDEIISYCQRMQLNGWAHELIAPKQLGYRGRL